MPAVEGTAAEQARLYKRHGVGKKGRGVAKGRRVPKGRGVTKVRGAGLLPVERSLLRCVIGSGQPLGVPKILSPASPRPGRM